MIEARELYIAPAAASRVERRALIVGVIGLILVAVGAVFHPARFLQSYLFAYQFTLGLALGSMAILMMQYLTSGDWGVVTRRILEAAMRTLPWLAIGFLPIIAGVRELYVWARPAQVAAEGLEFRTGYLNIPFFIVRAIIYFAVWLTIAQRLNRWSREQDRGDALAWLKRLRRLSGPGLMIYGVTITFAAFDWLMSLNPEWFSTIFGFLIIVGQALSATSLVILVAALLSRREPMASVFQPRHFHDLGKVMLSFVILWAYMSFSQLLIIWAGDLPQEIPFYLPRMQSSWRWIGVVLITLHFGLPFALLLSRNLKRRARSLATLAGLALVMRVIDLFWLVAPEFRRQGLRIDWFDPVTVIGVCGVWLALFIRELKARPMLPLRDPHLIDALSEGEQYSVNRRE